VVGGQEDGGPRTQCEDQRLDRGPQLRAGAPTTKASKHHAVTSSTAAHERASVPTAVRCSPRSFTIRASTGNAVTDSDTPRKRANGVKDTSAVARRG